MVGLCSPAVLMAMGRRARPVHLSALLILCQLQPSWSAFGAHRNPRRERRPPQPRSQSDGTPVAVENGVTALTSPVALDVTFATEARCVEDWFARECTEGAALGFDTETKPSFRKGQVFAPATLQLSTPTACLVVHLLHLNAMPPVLADTLASPAILKVGVGIDDDAIDLWLHHGLETNARFDLAKSVDKSGTTSLRGLTQARLGVQLDKSNRLTLTDWSKRRLRVDELQYAALDAWAGRALHDEQLLRRRRSHGGGGASSACAIAEELDEGESLLGESLFDLLSDDECTCAELYAYRRVRQTLRRAFVTLDGELAEEGLPNVRSPQSADSKRRAKQVRRTVERARREAAALFAANAVTTARTASGGGATGQSAKRRGARGPVAQPGSAAAEVPTRTRKLQQARAADQAQEQERVEARTRRLAQKAQRKHERAEERLANEQ